MNCPVCLRNQAFQLRKLYDDRYAYPGEFTLLKCAGCGHVYLDHSFSEQDIGYLYTDYYPRKTFKIEQYNPHQPSSGFTSWFNGEKASAYRWVPMNVTVLDVGCGFGESLGYHANRGCDVYGVEADANIERMAKKFGFNVHVGPFNEKIYEEGFFDYVTMDQVIEHLIDPRESIRGIAKILKAGGHLIISTPNVKSLGARFFGQWWINWHAPYHLQHFSKEPIKILTESEGFKLKNVHTITSSEWLFYQWQHLLMYPDIGNPSVFWNKIYILPKWKKVMLRVVIRLHKMKFNHILTRLFDIIGYGDNKIYILQKK